MSKSIKVELVGDASSVSRAFNKAGESGERFGKISEGLREQVGSLAKAFVAGAAAFEAGEFLKGSIEKSEALHKAQESLAAALEHTGASVKKMSPAFTATAKAAAEFGINQADATAALAKATLITGNARKAQMAYREAVAISKATGKDLGAVLLATAKAQNGQTGALKRYGVMLDSSASSQQQLNTVMAAYGGQAQANTTASEKLRANFDNLQANIGSLLLPAFDKIVEGLNALVTWFMSPKVSGAIHGFVSEAVAAIQPLVNWVRDHLPEIEADAQRVFTGLKGVVNAVIGELEAVWSRFGGNIVSQLRTDWDLVHSTVRNALQIIRGIIDVFAGLIHGDWSRVWHGLKEILGGVFDEIAAIVKAFGDTLHNAFSVVGKGAVDVLKGAFDLLWPTIRTTVDLILGAINLFLGGLQKLFDAASHIPFVGDKFKGVAEDIGRARDGVKSLQDSIDGLHGKTIDIVTHVQTVTDNYHHRAAGGPVTAGQPYVVGEHGQELFVPSTNGRIVPNHALSAMAAASRRAVRGVASAQLQPVTADPRALRAGGDTTINVTLPNYLGDKREVASVIRDELIRIKNRTGSAGL
ncbi:MAG: hypothetical protein ABUS54_10265 [Actinomycetota bacterium]